MFFSLKRREQLIENAFSPLTENYQKCSYSAWTVAVNQAGATMGTLSLATPLCITVILVLVYFGQLSSGRAISKTYTASEKQEALEELALRLLLVRDRGQEGGGTGAAGAAAGEGSETDSNKGNRVLKAYGGGSGSSSRKRSVLEELVNELRDDPPPSDQVYRSVVVKRNTDPVTINWGAVRHALSLEGSASSSSDSSSSNGGRTGYGTGAGVGAGAGGHARNASGAERAKKLAAMELELGDLYFSTGTDTGTGTGTTTSPLQSGAGHRGNEGPSSSV
jgi:hypothetical protein